MLTFALIGDYQYKECMELNISQIRKLHPHSRIVIGNLGGNFDYENVISFHQTERECLMMMKSIFLLNCVYRYGQVCLMDGDTVLLKKIDLKGNVVTVRKSKHGRINSGVVLSNDTEFVNNWISKGIHHLGLADISREQLCEQKALIDIVDFGGHDVKEVPCDVYNYSKVENGIPDSVKIVHLKSGRFKKPELIQKVKERIQ